MGNEASAILILQMRKFVVSMLDNMYVYTCEVITPYVDENSVQAL